MTAADCHHKPSAGRYSLSGLFSDKSRGLPCDWDNISKDLNLHGNFSCRSRMHARNAVGMDKTRFPFDQVREHVFFWLTANRAPGSLALARRTPMMASAQFRILFFRNRAEESEPAVEWGASVTQRMVDPLAGVKYD
jgi:hypothetical protein